MKRFHLWLGGTLSMVLAVGLYVSFPSQPPIPDITLREPVYDLPRTLRYSYTLRNTGNSLTNGVDFWVYAPVKQTATQKTKSVTASYPYTMLEDRYGNQIMHFHFDAVPPYDTKMISVKAQLNLAGERNPLAPPPKDFYLNEEPYIEVAADEIQTQAAVLGKSDSLETAKNIYTWLTRNVKYSGYVREDHGALYALTQRQGDCTEYMNLFCALGRANGIQARGVGGYVLKENALVKPADYHNWAEFYADDSWHMVDAQEKVFAERQHEYIAMRIIGEDDTSPLNGVHRFRVAGDSIEVVMN
ncbi:transglutaminase-like domain-containing protein [Pseudomonadota bacterium]